MRAASALILAGAGLAAAQGLNYTTSGPLNITASQVNLTLRESWCNSQTTICPEICGGSASPNTCDPDNLSYQCVCTNGAHPNVSSYSQSLPFFLCLWWKGNCIANHPNDYSGQQTCMEVKCGDKNATALAQTTASSSSSMAASTSAAKTSSSASGSGASSTSSKGMAAATNFAQNYGTPLLAGGMFALFGLAL